jgi:hypothetical protein
VLASTITTSVTDIAIINSMREKPDAEELFRVCSLMQPLMFQSVRGACLPARA